MDDKYFNNNNQFFDNLVNDSKQDDEENEFSILSADDIFGNFDALIDEKETKISYQIPEEGWVGLHVFNMSGQVVRTLVEGKRKAGYYTIIWDGRDDRGEMVASDIYLYRIESGDFREIKKMILFR